MESKNEERIVRNSAERDDSEIDTGIEALLKIQRSISKFFMKLSYSVSYLFQVIRKRLLFLIISIIIGAGAGILLYFNTTPTYHTSMTLTSRVLDNRHCATIIENLQLIVDDESYNLLAKTLKVSEKVAEQIDEIEYANLYKIEDDKDTVLLGIPFKISLSVYDPAVIDTMQVALVNYLEDNEYSHIRKAIRKQEKELLIEKFQGEISQLDSLKGIIAASLIQRGTSSGIIFGEPLDPLNVYRESIKLYKQELELNSNLILNDNIQVISPFMAREKPDSPKLLLNIIIGGLIAFFIGFLIALRLEIKRSAKLN